jgi:hypothetical protein
MHLHSSVPLELALTTLARGLGDTSNGGGGSVPEVGETRNCAPSMVKYWQMQIYMSPLDSAISASSVSMSRLYKALPCCTATFDLKARRTHWQSSKRRRRRPGRRRPRRPNQDQAGSNSHLCYRTYSNGARGSLPQDRESVVDDGLGNSLFMRKLNSRLKMSGQIFLNF